MTQDARNVQIIAELVRTVVEFDTDGVQSVVEKAINESISPIEILEKGLSVGIKEIGHQFGLGNIFLPELIMGAKTMQQGVAALEAHWKDMVHERKVLGTVVLGTVKGDMHSIGKQIVGSLFTAGGFEIINLGEDVPKEIFVEKVESIRPDIVGLSALLTTTLPQQKSVITSLKEAGLRDMVKVMIGGAPTTEEWAIEIGADGWAPNAALAVEKARMLLNIT